MAKLEEFTYKARPRNGVTWKTKKTKKRKPRKVRIEREGSTSKWWLYVLELELGRYYVGISTNVARRYKRHLSGGASVMTTRFKPVRIVETTCLGVMSMSSASRIENQKARDLVKKYGVLYVSGGVASMYHVGRL